MIYLDYAATTPTDSEILKTFCDVSTKFIANPNSLHRLGVEAMDIIDKSTEQVANLLGIKESEVIYTSGATESNNMAIIGICKKYCNRGKHIITTSFEHSSIYGPVGILQKEGFDVSFAKTDSNGLVDLDDLKKLITDETILVSVSAVNSEIGIKQNINDIGEIINKRCYFHVDMTQALGKINIDLSCVDLASFSAHKIYGIKGIGMLYKKEGISILPIISGGKSTTIFRSGTPATGLIVSFAKAMRLILEDFDKKVVNINNINKSVVSFLKDFDNVYINSNSFCIPNILNFSFTKMKPETLLHAFEKYDIFISTQTACSSSSTLSKSVLALTGNEKIASSSVRISFSHLTTENEISSFKKAFTEIYNRYKG